MFRGRIVEMAGRDQIFDRPRHPYTCSLLNAVAELSGDAESGYRLTQREFRAPHPPQGLTEDRRYLGEAGAKVTLVEVAEGHLAAFSAAEST
jgi:ABC-type oligopeptide transport system ATPase subunit